MPQPFGGGVNLLLLFATCAALSDDGSMFLWAAFFSGLLLDASSGLLFGAYAASFLAFAILIRYSTQTIFTADFSVGTLSGAVVAAYLVTVCVLYGASVLASRYGIGAGLSPLFINRKVWVDLALDLVAAFPVYLLVQSMNAFVERQEHHRKVLL